MSSIFNYIIKYNVDFDEKSFNEVDNLIMSCFSYINFDGILSFKDKITVKDLYRKFLDNNIKVRNKNIYKLFQLMACSNRYSSLLVGNYESILDKSIEKQFAAITFFLKKDLVYISYRGTDDSLIGIKEDFNMTYMLKIPSQRESVKYIEKVLKNNDCLAIVGGHSKGGNLAIYASSFCKAKYRKRIIKIYNNDGPGFFSKIINSRKYNESLFKMITFVPETSIIGMLLNHKEEFIVVKSNKKLIMQHDLFSWKIYDDGFEKLKMVNKKSQFINDVMSTIVLIPKKDKKKFFDIIYQILISTNIKTMEELSREKVKNIKLIINGYKNLNDEEKKFFISIWKEIIRVGKYNIKKYLPKIKNK